MSSKKKKPWNNIGWTAIIKARPNEKIDADCVFTVGGDSLEPFLSDGDLVLVKYTDNINHNEVGVFWADNRVRIMRMYQKDGVRKLISLNLDYPDAEFIEGVECIGRVVGRVDKDRVEKIEQLENPHARTVAGIPANGQNPKRSG